MKVQSSNISEINYDAVSKLLIVHFIKGGVYSYKNVEESVFDDFVKSESVGSFFHKNIKSKYEFEKLNDQNNKGEQNGN